jgi:TolA-binding protein
MRFLIIPSLLLALSAATIAPRDLIAAEQKRATLQVEERKRAKPDPASKKATGPRRSAVFATQVEKKLIVGIDKTTAYLEKTAKSLPKKSAQRLQILERILNLHMEQATYVRSEEERAFDKRWKQWEASGKKGPEPRLSTNKSMGHWKKVISQSSEILVEYPRSENADQITYNKAVALQYLGKEKDSAKIFTQLIQQYPNSAIAGDAYASLGDFYFDRNDFNNARANFTKALKYKRSKRYLWSMFKLGWCFYNLGDYKGSLGYWKQLVVLARGSTGQDGNLREEALRDMVYAFAELKQIDEAIAYYRANGGTQYIGPFLTLLAQILSDQGAYNQSIAVLKRFQSLVPNDPEGANAQKEIISLYAALGTMPKVWVELEKYALQYGPPSNWAKANDKKLVLETQNEIKDQMLYYSTLTHQNAIKDDNRAGNLEARKGYLLFVKYFPKAREVTGVKYYLADIEYYLKDYKAAGRYYLEIAALGKANAIKYNAKSDKGENIHKECSINMVNAFVKDFEPEFKVLKKEKPDFTKPTAVSVRARNYVKACGKYVEWYPDDKERVKSCDIGVTDVFYHSGQKDMAIKYLKNVAVKYAGQKEGQNAVDSLVPIVKNDRAQLLTTAQFLLKVPEYRNGKVGVELRNIQRGAEKEDIAKEGDTFKRAQKFEAQARKYPTDPDVDKLWYNAAVDYLKAGAVQQAITAYLVIVQKFPDKPQAKESLLQVGQIYEKQLEYDKASEYYTAFARKYPKEKEALPALVSACELQIALNTPKALGNCNALSDKDPSSAQYFTELLIAGAERAKRTDQLVTIIKSQYLQKFKLTPNQQIIAYYRIYRSGAGEAAQAAGQINQIFASNASSVSGEALRYVGELAYRKAEGAVPNYMKQGLVGGNVANLAKSIENKALGLKKVEQQLSAVTNTKDAYWGVAAIYQLGLANEHFAEILSNPPAIEGASKEDVIKQLTPQIQGLKGEAMKWYKTAQDLVTQFKVYNDWSIRTLAGINRMSGKKMQFDDYVVAPDFLGSELASSMASSLKGGKE